MAIELATGYVSIVPSAKGFAKGLGDELDGPLDDAGSRAGASSSSAFGRHFKAGLATVAKAGAAALVVGVAAGIVLLKDAVGAASDLNESTNAVNVTFGEAAKGVLGLGKNAAQALGLSNNEFNGLAVRFSSFASTIAGSGGDVVSTLDEMTVRAADFASVMNLDVKDAAELFQSGLAGESEPLLKYGIDLSAAAVANYAMANGITASGEAMTEAEKVQARYGLLMEQTSKTQGDFANTSDGLANQQRILKASFENSKAAIGTALLPVMAAIMPVVQRAAEWLGEHLPAAMKVVGDWVKANWPQIKTVIVGVFNAITTAVSFFINNLVSPLVSAFKATFGWLMDNKEVLIGIAAALAVGLGALFVTWAAGAAAAAAATIAAAAPFIAIGIAIAAVVAGVIYAYNNFEVFRTVVDAVASFLTDTLWPILKEVGSFLADVFAVAWTVVKTQIDIVTTAIGFVIDVVKDVWHGWLEPLIEFFEDEFSTGIDVAVAVIDSLKAPFEAIIGFIQDMIDKAEEAVDWLKKLNPLNWNLAPGGGIDLSKLPGMPSHAQGAIVPGPQLSIIGDAPGGEAVLTRPQVQDLMNWAGIQGSSGQAQIVVNNNRRDIGVGDLSHILAMARLAS